MVQTEPPYYKDRFEEEIQGSIKKINDKKKERRKDEDEVDGKRGEEKREDDKI